MTPILFRYNLRIWKLFFRLNKSFRIRIKKKDDLWFNYELRMLFCVMSYPKLGTFYIILTPKLIFEIDGVWIEYRKGYYNKKWPFIKFWKQLSEGEQQDLLIEKIEGGERIKYRRFDS